MNKEEQKWPISRKWIGIVIAACLALPILVALGLSGGLAVLFDSSIQPDPIASDRQTSNQQTVAKSTNPAASPETTTNINLEPARNWQANNHVHGLAVNPTNPNLLYVATHNGLLQRNETQQWFWMQPEAERADYMGFTADLSNPNRFYASGHPPTGGNLGFQVTNDQAQSWQQQSMPGVDFHALATAPSDPNIFYGFAASGAEELHVSTDGGKTWTKSRAEGLAASPFNLVVDPVNPKHLYAVTQAGLYQSLDQGETWATLSGLQNAPVVGLALQREADQTVMYGYRPLDSAPGIYRSTDGGGSWDLWSTGTDGLLLYLAIAPNNAQIFYAVNDSNAVFQSQDGGKTWKNLG